MNKLSLVFCLTALLAGCAIQQRVTPVNGLTTPEVCIIENIAVRAGFSEELRNSLASKGYQARMVAANSPTSVCPVSVTYVGRWTWDLRLYMSYAEIKVFSAGQPAGEAVYDSTGGGATLSKFIDASVKIRELVDKLFPAKAGA
jgi:hypothetical protein